MEKSIKTQYNGLGPLPDGGKVVIIGGGPGGTATAISLLMVARSLGRHLRVTILEGKQFAEERHHNQCVGVLSPPIMGLLEDELCVPFPYHLSRGLINGYILHTTQREVVLDGESDASVAVRRVQFDAFMTEAARKRGVDIFSARATDLEFHNDRVII